MPYAEIPNIQNIPDTVEQFVPEPVEIYRNHDGSPEGFVVPLDQDIRNTVLEVFADLGVPRDKNLEDLGNVLGRVITKRLALHSGLRIELGPWEQDPAKVIDVNLRPDTQID